MIREAGIDFANLPEENYDSPLGAGTGAAVIFGTTGGVMEAALRTVAEVVLGEEIADVEYNDVRGMEQTREAVIKVGEAEVKIAVVHTLVLNSAGSVTLMRCMEQRPYSPRTPTLS